VNCKSTILAAVLAAVALPAVAAENVVPPKGEIRVGTIQDLSGPIAALGKASRNGMLLWADEVNEQGGIHGRKVKIVVDGSGYDPKKAVLAAQKQARSDKVFVSVGNIGTPVALAAMPIFFDANIPHLFPITAARQMYEPLHKLKYSFAATYIDQMRSVIRHFTKIKADRKWCILYQDDDFGLEVLKGTEEGLKEIGGKTLVERATYKRGATDFSSQVQKLQASGCDTAVLGTIIRETVGAHVEARKIGWNPQFVGPASTYSHLIPALGGPAVEGMVSAHGVGHPYLDDASQKVQFWAKKYKTRFNEDPDVYSVYGYMIASMTGASLAKAGPTLSTDTFIKALDSLTYPDPMFGGDTSTFSPKKHLGSNKSRMAQIKNGRWVEISDYVEP